MGLREHKVRKVIQDLKEQLDHKDLLEVTQLSLLVVEYLYQVEKFLLQLMRL